MMTAPAGQWRTFLAAVQYFTRLPVPRSVGHEPSELGSAVRYLPAVGLLVGALGALGYLVTLPYLRQRLAVLIALAVTMLVTGAFHEDGLADSADGLGGARDRERALAIMKDPTVGTFGVLALVVSVLLKWEALASLPAQTVAGAMVASHAISRVLTVALMASLPYIGSAATSRAAPLVTVSQRTLVIAALTGALPLLYLGRVGVLAALAAGAACLVWRSRLQARLGGYTGDGLGAAQQLTELSFVVALVVLEVPA